METKELKLSAEWTDDCQGKKDYDGRILSVSTRYWPRGGSHIVLNNGQFESDGNSPERQEIKPSAKSSLVLWHGESDYIDLIEQDFEGETEEDVKKQVEHWAQEKFENIVALLKNHYELKQ